jgi:DNA-binding IscR family transcriptional regulator
MAYVRQNIHNLKHLEQNVLSNRNDKLRIALMVMIKIAKNFISGKEQSSQLEVSEELDIPIKEISDCLSNLEKSGVIIEIAKKQETYTINIPLDRLTVGVIADAVDMSFIENKHFKSEKDFPELGVILSAEGLKAGRKDLLTSFFEK